MFTLLSLTACLFSRAVHRHRSAALVARELGALCGADGRARAVFEVFVCYTGTNPVMDAASFVFAATCRKVAGVAAAFAIIIQIIAGHTALSSVFIGAALGV